MTPEVLALLKVAHAAASPDDWNVPSIYVSILEDHAKTLARGVPADDIIAHGKHVGFDCCHLFEKPVWPPSTESTCVFGDPEC